MAGLGNGNPKAGDKGSNHNYEHRHLLSLGNIVAALGPLAGVATEATLQLVLSAIQNGSEFEAKLVVDNNGDTWLEVRIWNTVAGTWDPPTYYTAGSNTPGAPALPISYINPNTLLSQIASNTTGISLEATQQNVLTQLTSIAGEDFATETTLSTLSTWITTNAATEATLASIDAQIALLNFIGTALEVTVTSAVLPTGAATETTLANLLAAFNAEDFATQTTLAALLAAFNAEDFATQTTLAALLTELQLKADLTETQPVSAASLPLPTGAATEATLLLLNALLTTIDADTSNLDVALSTRASEATLLLANALLTTIDADTSALTAAKTPTSVASTGVTNVPIGATEISVFNNGTGDATCNGVVLPAGVTRTFGFKNPTSAVIVCDGGGTEQLIIDYMA